MRTLNSNSISVSELNAKAQGVLEDNFDQIRVHGEISSMTLSQAGHRYFTLKDDKCQVSCVFFRMRAASCKAQLENGEQVIVHGKLTLYAARGTYQILVSHIESIGAGALMAQIEALKLRLKKEGLFNPEHKKAIPSFPSRVGLVTSQKGAVIEDLMTTFNRRMPMIELWLYHSSVEGTEATLPLARAITKAGKNSDLDAIIVARGGGSFESLIAFNSEEVVRAIFNSPVPIICAVGHETDTSISDWAADLRAPTPTAAAELLSPDARQILAQLNQHTRTMKHFMLSILQNYDQQLTQMAELLSSPEAIFNYHHNQLEGLLQLLNSNLRLNLARLRKDLECESNQLIQNSPDKQIAAGNKQLEQIQNHLQQNCQQYLSKLRERIVRLETQIKGRNPKAILKAGYSILQKGGAKPKTIISAKDVCSQDTIHATLHQGSLEMKVTKALLKSENY